MFWRFLRRELRSQRQLGLSFLASLTIGLVGFILLDSLKSEFNTSLTDASQNLQTSDVRISARRPIADAERGIVHSYMQPQDAFGSTLSMYSMVASAEQSSLAQVKVIEPSYPFYGWIKLQHAGELFGSSPKPALQQDRVWVAADLLIKLNVKVGDPLQIGQSTFTIDDVIEDVSSAQSMGAELAPLILMGSQAFEHTQLLKPGSVVSYDYHIKLHQTSPAAFKDNLMPRLTDPALRIEAHTDRNEGSARLLQYLADYLSLVAIVAIVLANIGLVFLFRSYLLRKQRDLAILRILGLTSWRQQRYLSGLVIMLSAAAALVAALIAAFLVPAFGRLLADFSPLRFEAHMPVSSGMNAIIISVTSAFFCLWPLLNRASHLKANILLQDQAMPALVGRRQELGYWLPFVASLWAIACWQGKSWLIGSIFTLSLVLTVLVSGLLIGFILKALAHASGKWRWWIKLAIRNLSRQLTASITTFIAITLGALLLTLIPAIQASLKQEFSQPGKDSLPSLFVFDIQEDQLPDLEKLIIAQQGQLQQVSPMINGRITRINNKPFVRDDSPTVTREREEEQRFRNRGVNLTYRSTLGKAEEIVDGEPIPPVYNAQKQPVPYVSLEQRFARRMNIKIGDTITFEVQGLAIDAQVRNLRRIRWTSFQPNFFIQLQAGVIDDSPKTFVAALGALSDPLRHSLQQAVTKEFPNISMVHIAPLVTKVTHMVEQMAGILQLMGWLVVITGCVVIYVIVAHQAERRAQETGILKILGAAAKSIQNSQFTEMSVLAVAAIVFGNILGVVGAWGIMEAMFEGQWQWPWQTMLWIDATLLALIIIGPWRMHQRLQKRHIATYLNRSF